MAMNDNNRNESVFDRVKQRAAEAERKQKEKQQSHLVPHKHKQLDFFIADLFDTVSFRADMASMEHPIFALKAGDNRTRFYEHNGVSIKIESTPRGIATIHDKDIWIYCISKLMQAIFEGEDTCRTVHFTAYDFLVTTNRDTSGRSYERLKEALERLRGTSITTTIKTADREEANGFGLIDSWKIIKENNKGKMIQLSVTLPDWLYRSVTAKSVLTLSPDYFRLRKPLDRRIYEIARKHCGNQSKFKISLDILYKKSGSTVPLKRFRQAFKELSESNELPDYSIQFDIKNDIVTISSRNLKNITRELF